MLGPGAFLGNEARLQLPNRMIQAGLLWIYGITLIMTTRRHHATFNPVFNTIYRNSSLDIFFRFFRHIAKISCRLINGRNV